MRKQEQRNSYNKRLSMLPGDENFDFSVWAKLVRQQMMLSLQKRQREA